MTDNPSRWMVDALCRKAADPVIWDLFYDEERTERKKAQRICKECPVRLECLTTAIENKEVWGVWGGCDETELRRTLSVDVNGKPTKRSRPPNCPFCKAKSNKLYIASWSDVTTGQKHEEIRCGVCDFGWQTKASIMTLKTHLREQKKLQKTK